jgi:hypothetical protein
MARPVHIKRHQPGLIWGRLRFPWRLVLLALAIVTLFAIAPWPFVMEAFHAA